MAEELFHVGVKAIVRNGDGSVLLVRETGHSEAFWDLPGGRMEAGETFEATLRRELHEEVGLNDIDTVQPFMTVLSNKRIAVSESTVGLVLVTYIVTATSLDTLRANEPRLELAWEKPMQAAALLADKYSKDFCNKIGEL